MSSLRRSGLLAALLLLGVPTGARAGSLPYEVTAFKASIDIDLNVTQKTFWKGIQPGCFAPAENFSMTYGVDLDTNRPNPAGAKPTTAVASITPKSFGVAPTYGVKGSFRQSGAPGAWELQIANPGGCGSVPPSKPPSWAVSPSCNTIRERTLAILLQDGDGDEGNGVLDISRTPKIPFGPAAPIRPSCYRTLSDVTPVGLLSDIRIGLEGTRIEVPVPRLERELRKLARGSAAARPSFRIDIDVDGYCEAMTMKPSLGRDPDVTPRPFSQAHQTLGPFNGEPERTGCTIEAKGRAIVRREGPAQRASVVVPVR